IGLLSLRRIQFRSSGLEELVNLRVGGVGVILEPPYRHCWSGRPGTGFRRPMRPRGSRFPCQGRPAPAAHLCVHTLVLDRNRVILLKVIFGSSRARAWPVGAESAGAQSTASGIVGEPAACL